MAPRLEWPYRRLVQVDILYVQGISRRVVVVQGSSLISALEFGFGPVLPAFVAEVPGKYWRALGFLLRFSRSQFSSLMDNELVAPRKMYPYHEPHDGMKLHVVLLKYGYCW